MSNSRCPGCIHRRSLSDGYAHTFLACHYLLDTGEPRGCTAEFCYANKVHFRPKKNMSNCGREKIRAGKYAINFWTKG